MEVVQVGAQRLVEEDGDGHLGGDVGAEQPHQVQRYHHDEGRDDPCRHEVRDRWDRHDLERVDLFADPLGAELGGELAADLRRDGDRSDDRCDLAGVAVRGDEARQG